MLTFVFLILFAVAATVVGDAATWMAVARSAALLIAIALVLAGERAGRGGQ